MPLCMYGLAMCNEWRSRGYNDTCFDTILELMCRTDVTGMPTWLGNEAFHASHRSNLLRKDAVHYSQFGWSEPADLPYVWPAPKAILQHAV